MTVPSPEIQILWAVPVRFVRVSDLIEEVDLVFWKEKGDRHCVYRCVAPSLSEIKRDTGCISQESFEWRLGSWPLPRNKIRRCSRGNPRKQCRLRLSRTPYPRSPCYSNLSSISDRQLPQIDGVTHSGSRCTANHHRLKETPWSCSELGIAGTV